MFKLQGWVEEGNTVVDTGGLGSSNVVQGSFPGATVTVYIHGSNPATLATIYSDDNPSPTPLANPFTANLDGTWGFYADSGRYDVVFSGGTLSAPFTIEDLTNGAGGGTGDVSGPGTAIDGDIALWDGTSGKLIKDGLKLGSRLLINVDSGGAGTIPVYNDAAGTEVRASGILANSLVTSPNNVTQGNLAVFRSRTIIIDSGVSPTSLGGFVRLSQQILSGDAASVSFTGISQAYSMLKIIGYGRSTQATTFANVFIQINGDGSANYDYQYMSGNNTTVAGASAQAQTSGFCGLFPGTSSTRTTQVGMFEILIPMYALTAFEKQIQSLFSVSESTANVGQQIVASLVTWRSAAAINRVDFIPGANNFKAGSVFTLYGIT